MDLDIKEVIFIDFVIEIVFRDSKIVKDFGFNFKYVSKFIFKSIKII